MEQRKLIKLGNSSFAIALPKGWVDKAGLKKGENVFLEENGSGEIMIRPSPDNKKNNKEITIETANKDSATIKGEVRSAYIRGYSSLRITGIKDKAGKENLKKIFSEFLSFELIDSNEKEIIAKDFFSIEDSNIVNFIRRMDNNIREIFDIALEEIKKEKINPQKLKEIEEIDRDINKFYFLCSRIFMRGIDNPSIMTALKTDGTKLFNEWWLAFNLESLADGIKYLLRTLQKSENNNTEIIIETLSNIKYSHIKVMESFYKKDDQSNHENIKTTHELRDTLIKLEKEGKLSNAMVYDLDNIRKQVYQNAKMSSYIK